MDTAPAFGLREHLTYIITDIAKSLSGRPGETHEQQVARTQVAVHTILAFLPGTVLEAMLAGHCVMFHGMIVDSALTTLCGEDQAKRGATRRLIIAMDKSFGTNLARLERYQAARLQPAPKTRPAAEAQIETDIADRVRRHQSKTPPATGPSTAPSTQAAETPDPVAAWPANPAPVAATDPERFPRAMAAGQPREDSPLAAAGGFNRPAAVTLAPVPPANGNGSPSGQYAGNRQARCHPNR
jgi:hypothetical protein